MFNIICLLLLVSDGLAVLTPDKPYYDLTDAENHFAEFVQRYGKKYGNSEEYNKRFEIFKNKLTEINKLNEENDATFGVTKFSDLTFKEFESSHLSIIASRGINATEMVTVKKEWVLNAPKSLDYRTQNLVTHVKDQEYCHAGPTFAAIGKKTFSIAATLHTMLVPNTCPFANEVVQYNYIYSKGMTYDSKINKNNKNQKKNSIRLIRNIKSKKFATVFSCSGFKQNLIKLNCMHRGYLNLSKVSQT